MAVKMVTCSVGYINSQISPDEYCSMILLSVRWQKQQVRRHLK